MSTPHSSSSTFDTRENRESVKTSTIAAKGNRENPSNTLIKKNNNSNTTKDNTNRTLSGKGEEGVSKGGQVGKGGEERAVATKAVTKKGSATPNQYPNKLEKNINKWHDLSRKLVKAGQQPITGAQSGVRAAFTPLGSPKPDSAIRPLKPFGDTGASQLQTTTQLRNSLSAPLASAKAQKVFDDNIKQKHIGIVNIICTHNNTIINLTDNYGNVITNRTPRQLGFKGAKRSTSYAASVAAEHVYNIAVQCQFHYIIVQVKGFGPGRSSALYILTKRNLSILRIVDITPLPHNGCRAPKKRRI